MSLTSYLHKSGNPIREFFEQWFPNSRASGLLSVAVSRDSTSSAQQKWQSGPILVDPVGLSPSERGTIGTAFDYRVRFSFEGLDGIPNWVALNGARKLAALSPSSPKIPDALRQLITELEHLLGPRTDLRRLRPEREEMRLNQLCYILALYEQCARGNLNNKWPIAAMGTEASLEKLTQLCRPEILDDLTSMSKVFIQSPSPFWNQGPKVLNPRFEASESIGADADIIVGDTLIDMKTTDKARPDRSTIWQLIGYVLSDLHDEYSIRQVGFYYARYGTVLTWELNVLMEILAGRPVQVQDARDAFSFAINSMDERNQLEKTFERSIAAEPNRAEHYGAFAIFLDKERNDIERTDVMFQMALAIAPNLGNLPLRYAEFLKTKRNDLTRAQYFYERAVSLNSNDETYQQSLGRFARFLYVDVQDLDKAEAMFERAIAFNPSEPNNLGNYAEFLAFARNDDARAKQLFDCALAVSPNHTRNLANYSRFLFESNQLERAEIVAHQVLKEAILKGGKSVRESALRVSFYMFALLPHQRESSMERIRTLVEDGVRCEGFDSSVIVVRSSPIQKQFLSLLTSVIRGDIPSTQLETMSEWQSVDDHG